ncbi:MAG TPA: sugar phosphate nucleotidyltransferase [Bradyrhizobium sp.]
MWGIIPAAGSGMRIQPLAFSKELLPVGSRLDDLGVERPRAVSEYLVERMIRAGASKICFVISPWKSDIVQYYGGSIGTAHIAYVIQSQASGLCDAIFCAVPFVNPTEPVVVGLPDTVWFPERGLCELPDDRLSFLLFRVARPDLFDSVVMDESGRVLEIQVKSTQARSPWIWGAFKMPGQILHELHSLWLRRDRRDEYIGTLVNAWLAAGGTASGVCAGERYVDVGTLGGYREALQLLEATSTKLPIVQASAALPTARMPRPRLHNAAQPTERRGSAKADEKPAHLAGDGLDIR